MVGLDTREVIGGHLIELCELDKEVKGYLALAAFVKLVLLAGDAEDLCDFFPARGRYPRAYRVYADKNTYKLLLSYLVIM